MVTVSLVPFQVVVGSAWPCVKGQSITLKSGDTALVVMLRTGRAWPSDTPVELLTLMVCCVMIGVPLTPRSRTSRRFVLDGSDRITSLPLMATPSRGAPVVSFATSCIRHS